MSSAFDHADWTARGLRDFSEYADCVEYVNQEDDYGDCLRGEWWYPDDQRRVIYHGTFGNDHSPGASCYTYADDYDSEDEYRAAVAKWEALPEYLDSEDEAEDEADDEPSEPEEGDYVTEDYRRIYEHGGRRKPIVTVPEDADFGPWLRAWMERDGYFPNVWSLSDHGNWCLLSLDD